MKVVKENKKEQETFEQKWKAHKKEYLKNNTIESMVYENGSALAMLYKEIQRLNSLLTTQIKQDGKENND